jgi:L-alanine-DL-glutamate epimerase-like enolase superfamily enzyme
MICGRETKPDQISRNNRHPHRLHEHTLTTNFLTPVNGEFAVPEGPGLGVELEREALEHNTLKEL